LCEKYGLTLKPIQTILRRFGVACRRRIKRNQYGERNSFWRGGKTIMGSGRATGGGYRYVTAPDHPNAIGGRYVAEHTKIVADAEGRPLGPGEVVHHVNLDKRDNRYPQNLVRCTKSEHMVWHSQLERVAAELVKTGIIGFNREQGYFLIDH